MLAYADDIVVMGETREEVTETTKRVLKASMSMGLYVNENKTVHGDVKDQSKYKQV
jgi:hypothetical protein